MNYNFTPDQWEKLIKGIQDGYRVSKGIVLNDDEARMKVIRKLKQLNADQQRINVYFDKDIEANFIVTKELGRGKAPLMVAHPLTGKPLKSCCYFVPEGLKPEYEFYDPTQSEIKMMKEGKNKNWVLEGGMILRKIRQILIKPSL